MSRGAGISRREFVKAGAYSGAGLVLTFHHLAGALHAADAEISFAPSVYLRIQPEGKIQYWVTRSEMGQGVRTTLPMLLAEELEVDCAALELLAGSHNSRRSRKFACAPAEAAAAWGRRVLFAKPGLPLAKC